MWGKGCDRICPFICTSLQIWGKCVIYHHFRKFNTFFCQNLHHICWRRFGVNVSGPRNAPMVRLIADPHVLASFFNIGTVVGACLETLRHPLLDSRTGQIT